MTTKPLICIIDDAADYRFLVQFLFKRHFPHYSVALFSEGREFLDELAELNPLPSLILLDRHMPGLDGHQTLLCLKGQLTYKKIPVVMMSADASVDEINGCYEAGANSFLRKSIHLDSLGPQLELVCQYWLEANESSSRQTSIASQR